MSTLVKESFAVGDILYSSWGYDQTNIDFYQVVRTTAKSVWVKKLAKNHEQIEVDGLCDYVTPIKDCFADDKKPKMHRIQHFGSNAYIRITSFCTAELYKGGKLEATYYA